MNVIAGTVTEESFCGRSVVWKELNTVVLVFKFCFSYSDVDRLQHALYFVFESRFGHLFSDTTFSARDTGRPRCS